MTSLSDNGEGKKPHEAAVAYKKLEMWSTTNYLNKLHFNAADCSLKDILFLIHKGRGPVSAKQAED